MADAYDEVQKRQDQAKAGLLAAMAQDGSAATAAAQADAAAKASQRQEAIRSTLGGMAGRGAPAELQAQIGGQIGSVYDRSGDYAAGSKLSFDRTMGAIGAANANYHDQVRAAAPLARAALERAVARRRAKEQDELSDAELRTRLLGAAASEREQDAARLLQAQQGAERAIAEKRAAAQAETRAPFQAIPARLRGFEMGQSNVYQGRRAEEERQVAPVRAREEATVGHASEAAGRSDVERARRIGVLSGLDRDRVYGLIEEPEPESPQDQVARLTAEEKLSRAKRTGTLLPAEKTGPLTPLEVAQAQGLSQEQLAGIVTRQAKLTKAGKEEFDTDEDEGSPYQDVVDTYDEWTGTLPPAEIDKLMQQALKDYYGQDFPEIRQFVASMYGGS